MYFQLFSCYTKCNLPWGLFLDENDISKAEKTK